VGAARREGAPEPAICDDLTCGTTGKDLIDGGYSSGYRQVAKPQPDVVDNRRHLLVTSVGLQPSGAPMSMLVPEGFGPAAFVSAMQEVEHPMAAAPVLPATAEEAYRKQGGDSLELISWRLKVCMRIAEWARELEPERRAWAASLHPTVHAVIGHLHGPLLEKATAAVGHGDKEYFRSLTAGRAALGKIQPAGIYRPKARSAKMSLRDWLLDAPARNRRLIASVKSSGDEVLDALAWAKREKEIKTGAVRGPFRVTEVDLDVIAVHSSFPVWERGHDGDWKARNIDNLKASGGNGTVDTEEAYTPDDLDQARAAVRFCKELWGEAAVLAGFTSDYSGAFRQSPLSPDQVSYMWSAVWHPVWKEVVLLQNLAQVFGGAGSQFNYVRDPSAMCAIMRGMLAVAMFHYTDDAWAVERESTALSAWFCWVWLNRLIGWKLDMAKSPWPSSLWKLLGGLLHVGVPRPFASLPEDKVAALLEDIDVYLQTGVSSNDAASLRGRAGWSRSFLWGRYGSAILVPLRKLQYKHLSGRIRLPSIESSLRCLRRAIQEQAKREVPFDLSSWPLVVTVSDGEGTGSVAVGIWMPREPQFRPMITRADVPEMWLKRWSRGDGCGNRIMEIEAVGPLLAVSTWPSLFRDVLWLHFIDNESAKFSLIKGSSLAMGTNEIVHATWDECRKRRIYPWWERVSSSDNPVDKASRRDLRDLYGQDWQVVEPTLPSIWVRDFVGHECEAQLFQ